MNKMAKHDALFPTYTHPSQIQLFVKFRLIPLCPFTIDPQKTFASSHSGFLSRGQSEPNHQLTNSATPLKWKIFSASGKIATAYRVKLKGQSKFSEFR